MHTSFRGGIHPRGNKDLCKDQPLTRIMPSDELVYPLCQHIGSPAVPIVCKNDPVLVGQMIARADGAVSAPIFSGASGVVKAIEARMTGSGQTTNCIVIRSDGVFTPVEGMGVETKLDDLSGEEILRRIADAGIVGLGGAGFPTHVKLSPKDPLAIRHIIANGSECEPYITCDDRLMQEQPEAIVGGLAVVLKLFPNASGVIAIENNKPAAIRAMQNAIRGNPRLKILKLKTRYPQGGERNLVHAVTGRRMAARDLPSALGCIVHNVSTLAAIYRAVCFAEPLIEKPLTITGDAIARPANFIVRIGTPVAEIIEAAGGFAAEPKKILLGGPMMGVALTDASAPIVKTSNAVVCMTRDYAEEAGCEMTACIRCGRCIQACPMGLLPQMMAVAAQRRDYERYNQLHGLSCISCGCCTYVCPAKRPLMQLFKATNSAANAAAHKEANK